MLVALGCAPAPTPVGPAPAAPVRAPARQRTTLEPRDFETLAPPRTPVTLTLPQLRTWSVDDASGPWLTVEHQATRSRLELRFARAARLVTLAQCREELHLARPQLPAPSPQGAIPPRPFAPSQQWDGELYATVAEASGGELKGEVVGVAAGLGRCLFVVTTLHTPKGAEAELAERLSLFVDAILPRLTLRELEARVPSTGAPGPLARPR